ncbi:MAG: hypothetical protein HGA45_31290 [Chloroflexales bacterium]|nr:hypothetical protein [Chloroflexales bacterium]
MPAWLICIFQAVPVLMPEVLICAAIGLIVVGLARGRAPVLSAAALALSVALVFLAGARIYLESILDAVPDRSGAIGMVLRVSIISITAAVLLTLFLSSWRRIVGPCFALIVVVSAPLALQAGFEAGPVTERLANVVGHAIERYHADHQSYPRALAELTPWYLIVVPQPVIVAGDRWCYDGGVDYYRLGYVSHINSPNDLYLVASAGVPPPGPWRCKAAASP